MKTIKLPDRPRVERPERISDILTGAMLISVLLFARDTLNGQPAQQIKVVTLKPAILIQRETSAPQPTWTPAPTPAPQMIYIEAPTPEPVVVYVEVPQAAPPAVEAPAVATPAPPAPALQTLALPPGEDLSPALLREAMDK